MQPLLPTPTQDDRDPLRWPVWLKRCAIITASLTNFITNMAGSGLSVAVPNLMREYRKSESAAVQLLTYNFLFLSIGNIFWVPLANKFGKRASLLLSMALQAGTLVWCATATSFSSLLAARCVQGFAGAAGESIVPELAADIFFLHQRAAMMSIYVILISGGTAIGPLVNSLMVQYLSSTWRAFMWLCFALAVADIFLIFFMCPESNFRRPEWDLTSPSGLDTAEAEKKNGANDIFFENVPPEAGYTVRQPSLADMIVPIRVDRDLNFFQAMVAPLRGLTRPAVIWVVLLYGCALSPQIIFIFTMSSLLEAPPYIFSSVAVGLMEVAALIGFLLACYGGGMLSDLIHDHIVRRRGYGQVRAEDRLLSLIPGMAIGPAGCVLLAFFCQNHLHWAAIAVGFGMVSFGSVYTPNIAITYLAHRHQRDAAQCLVLVNVVKNLVAFLFLYEAVEWVQSQGYLQVYLVMFALGVATIAGALPLYLFDRKQYVE
ncbi:MFS transporter [Aspergillus flavus]|nr:MFS transporter [Aspergillus flavus]RAQ74189.1 MFS transporter [Aspergillus flavus]